MNDLKPLTIVVRVLGGIDMLAFAVVIMPKSWIEAAHVWAGLGSLPDGPVVGYLARSAALLYALHGLLIVYMSFDVARYWQLIRVFASLAIVHGLLMLGIDLAEGMPLWWRVVEAPSFAATGIVVLVAQSCVARPHNCVK